MIPYEQHRKSMAINMHLGLELRTKLIKRFETNTPYKCYSHFNRKFAQIFANLITKTTNEGIDSLSKEEFNLYIRLKNLKYKQDKLITFRKTINELFRLGYTNDQEFINKYKEIH